MSLTLNLTGLIPDFSPIDLDEDFDKQRVKRRNKQKNGNRKAVGLDFTNLNRPYADALNYWKDTKMATPLIWMLFDTMGNCVDANEPNQKVSLERVLTEKDPDLFAKNLIQVLRNKHKDNLEKLK